MLIVRLPIAMFNWSPSEIVFGVVSEPYANMLFEPPTAESNMAIATTVPWSPPEAAGNVMADVFEIEPDAAEPIRPSI